MPPDIEGDGGEGVPPGLPFGRNEPHHPLRPVPRRRFRRADERWNPFDPVPPALPIEGNQRRLTEEHANIRILAGEDVVSGRLDQLLAPPLPRENSDT